MSLISVSLARRPDAGRGVGLLRSSRARFAAARAQWRRKKGVRGEALDCRVYAIAALQALASMGLSLERECERVEAMAARCPAQESPRVSYSRWMQA